MRAAPRVLLLLAVTGCTSSDPMDRTEEIVSTLTYADRGLIADRTVEVQAKYQKMGDHAFNFVRGSMALYHHDLETRDDVLNLSHEKVLSNGDPHPENLGTFGDASGVLVDWNDYDAAGHVPLAHDLIRSGYSLVVFIEEATEADPEPALDEFLWAYQGTDPGDGGKFIAKLAERAIEKGAARDELDDVTDGPVGPIFERDEETIDAEPAFAAELLQALPAYAPTRIPGAAPLGALRDVVRILGKGVTSHPLERYLVLLAGNQPDGSEDRVLELKEVWDPSVDEYGHAIGSQAFVAHRIVDASRELGVGPALDLDLGVLLAGGKAFVVKGASGYVQDLDFDRVKEKYSEGDYSKEDLPALGRFVGGTLAIAHRRAGADTTHLAQRADAREAILAFARQAQIDHSLFQDRLAEGPIVVPK